jgi:cobalt/nickel transport system permease protein
MLNFSIGNGTSGHFLGAALCAILLGPEGAVLVIAAVIIVQALVFADGGSLAIGVNILNMSIVASYSAHFVYTRLKKQTIMGGFFAAWTSIIAASLSCALLLGIGGPVQLSKVIPAMLMTHMFIGIGEGLITGSILLYIHNTKHGLLDKSGIKGLARYVAVSTMGALAVVSLALPFASQSPDGLEKVALNLGFFDKAKVIHTFQPMADYTLPGIEGHISTIAAGIMGMALVFGLAYLAGRMLQRKKAETIQ